MADLSNGGIHCPGNLRVDGNSDFHGDVEVDGNQTVAGTLAVTSTATFLRTQVAAAVNGAITIAPETTVVFTKAGVAEMTLAAPSAAQAGTRMTFTAGTANAHTLTATGLIEDGVTGGAKNVATFAAFVGSSLELEARALKWHVVSKNACVIT
jgi:hypothetical protein